MTLPAIAIAVGLALGQTSASQAGSKIDHYDAPREDRLAASKLPPPERDSDELGALVPDYLKLQTAGYVGVGNVRVGYAFFNDIANAEVGYGFNPPHGEQGAIHSLDLALAVRPFELNADPVRWVPLYAGAGIIYLMGGQFEARYPERYQRIASNYYYPTALHWTAFVGTQLGYRPNSGFFEKHSLYYQLVTMDTFAVSFVQNDEITLIEATSSTLGYRADF